MTELHPIRGGVREKFKRFRKMNIILLYIFSVACCVEVVIMGLECGETCAKYILFFVNLIIFVSIYTYNPRDAGNTIT